MTTLAFRDLPRRGASRVLWMLAAISFAIAGGTGLGFLTIVFAGVAGGEVDPDTWLHGSLDTMLRQSVGVAALVLGAALGVGTVVYGFASLSFARQLARAAERTDSPIAAWDARRLITTTDPFGPMIGFSIFFLSIDGIAIIIFALTLGQSRNPEDIALGVTLLLGAIVLAIVMIALLVYARKTGRPAFLAACATARESWTESVISAAEAAELARRGRATPTQLSATPQRVVRASTVIMRTGSIAAAIGMVAFFLGLFARQPCRLCDPRTLNAIGEASIDALMTFTIPVTGAAIALVLLSFVLRWLATVLEHNELADLARRGAGQPLRTALVAALTGAWPGTTAAFTLIGLGWGIAPVILSADAAVPGILPTTLAPALLAIGALGVVVLWWAIGAQARAHNLLREAWSPGDVVPPPPETKKRKNRRARKA